jgi:hypothetical protein
VKVQQHDGYSTTSFMLFAHPTQTTEITVSAPHEMGEAAYRWVLTLELPEDHNAWATSFVKPARWPSGYKQLGEHTHTFVTGSVES